MLFGGENEVAEFFGGLPLFIADPIGIKDAIGLLTPICSFRGEDEYEREAHRLGILGVGLERFGFAAGHGVQIIGSALRQNLHQGAIL